MFFNFGKNKTKKELCNKEKNMTQENMELEKVQGEERRPVTSAEDLDQVIERAKAAQRIFATYTQEQVDKIFRAASLAANKARIPLAKMAHEESGMGVVED